MQPALRPGEYVLARRLRDTQPLMRGEIVVTDADKQPHIKRVIGLPGERIAFNEGSLYIDGETLEETYLHGLPPYLGLGDSEFELGSDHYFLMGDNRSRSTDSRHYGPVHRARIEGRVVCHVWPPRRWGRL